jgi:hypothetical protein
LPGPRALSGFERPKRVVLAWPLRPGRGTKPSISSVIGESDSRAVGRSSSATRRTPQVLRGSQQAGLGSSLCVAVPASDKEKTDSRSFWPLKRDGRTTRMGRHDDTERACPTDHVAVTSVPCLGCTRPAQASPDGDARLTSSPAAVDRPPQPEKPPPPFFSFALPEPDARVMWGVPDSIPCRMSRASIRTLPCDRCLLFFCAATINRQSNQTLRGLQESRGLSQSRGFDLIKQADDGCRVQQEQVLSESNLRGKNKMKRGHRHASLCVWRETPSLPRRPRLPGAKLARYGSTENTRFHVGRYLFHGMTC